MIIRSLMVLTYIFCCLRIAAAPWRYFQLNAKYFSDQKGIFSKIEIDKLIPGKWRLDQYIDDGVTMPAKYPIFHKPEWGQNAQGISLIKNTEDLQRARTKISQSNIDYILQKAANEAREFEIFSIMSYQDNKKYAVLTVTESTDSKGCKYPINSIYNPNTNFQDITAKFSTQELEIIWNNLIEIGDFKISRLCVRANSHDDLINGKFSIIEINLFLPMPINLLDKSYTWSKKIAFIRMSMRALAQTTKSTTKIFERAKNSIFARKMLYQKRLKVIDGLRSIL